MDTRTRSLSRYLPKKVPRLPGHLRSDHEVSLLEVEDPFHVHPDELRVLPGAVQQERVMEEVAESADLSLVGWTLLGKLRVEGVLYDPADALSHVNSRECAVDATDNAQIRVIDLLIERIRIRSHS